MHAVADIRRLLRGADAEHDAACGTVWRIGADDRLLEAVADAGRFLIRHESPIEWEIPGRFREAATATWWVDGPFDPGQRDTAAWLAVGDWIVLGGAADPAVKLPDLARTEATGVLEIMVSAGLTVLISSFHDNAEWTVAIRHEPPPLCGMEHPTSPL